MRIDGPHDDLVALRRRIIKARAPHRPPPGRLETVASILLHRAAPFDPEVQVHLAGRWGLTSPAATEPDGNASSPETPLRAQGALWRLRRLAAGCPPPIPLTRALELAAATAWTEQGLRQALALMGLSEGTAGAPLVRALSTLWHPGAALPLWPSPTRQGELRGLADRVRHAGILTGVGVPERLDAADSGWLSEQRLVLQPAGCLVASADRTSSLSHPLRRQLACVGALSAAELLEGLLRARPGYRDLDAAAIGVWAAAQHDVAALSNGHFVMRPGTRTWQLGSDPVILELVGAGQTASRRDILARLVADGLTPASASLRLVRCLWLRPAGQRAVFRRVGRPATSPAPGRPPSRERRPRGMSAD